MPSAISRKDKNELLAKAEEYLPAEIHMFAAGRVGQKSMETSDVKKKLGFKNNQLAEEIAKGNKKGGATTSSLLKTLYKHQKNPAGVTWKQVLDDVRGQIKKVGLEHVAQLSSSRPIEDTEKFSILPRGKFGGRFSGKKRALIIGCNYRGTHWFLPGCQNDAWNMIKYLREVQGFTDDEMTIMLDDGKYTIPDAEAIKHALHEFCFSLEPGDAAFFHFSGHGAQLGDNQVLLAIDDNYIQKRNHYVEDSDIFRLLLLPLPKGVKLTAVVDCCHSGQMFNLPFQCLDEGHHFNIYEPKFTHAKYYSMERMRIDSIKAINMPPADTEAMVLPPPKFWRERTFGEGWNEFWDVKLPVQTQQNGTVLRRVRRKPDARSVASAGALEKRRRVKSQQENPGPSTGLAAFLAANQKKSSSDDRSVTSGLSALTGFTGLSGFSSNRRKVSSGDRSVCSTGALEKRKKVLRRKIKTTSNGEEEEEEKLSKWKSVFSDNSSCGRRRDDNDDRSVASMGALDRRKRRIKKETKKKPSSKKLADDDDGSVASMGAPDSKTKRIKRARKKPDKKIDAIDSDDRSVVSMGALELKKKATRIKDNLGDLTGISTKKKSSTQQNGRTDSVPAIKKRPALKRVGSAIQLGRNTDTSKPRRGKRSSTTVAPSKITSLVVRKIDDDDDDRTVGSAAGRRKKRLPVGGKSDDDDDRSVGSAAGRRIKRLPIAKSEDDDDRSVGSAAGRRIKRLPIGKSEDDDDRSVASAGGRRKKRLPLANSDDDDDRSVASAGGGVKKRPGMKRVGSAHQLGSSNNSLNKPRRRKRHSTAVAPSNSATLVRRQSNVDDDDDDRSVASMGALELRKKSLIKKKIPTKQNDCDDRSVASMGAPPIRKRMPRNQSTGGLNRLSNGAAPIKRKPGLTGVGSAHQLGRKTRELGQNNMQNKQWPKANNSLAGMSEHGTKSTGFGVPKKHKPGTLGALHPNKHVPGSYLPGALSTSNHHPRKHKPGQLAPPAHKPGSRVPPIRSKSDIMPARKLSSTPPVKKMPGRNPSNNGVTVQYIPLGGEPKKKQGSLSVSQHSAASLYSSEHTSDGTPASMYEDSDCEGKPSKRNDIAFQGTSAASFMSEMTDDDASLTDDDDDEFLNETENGQKSTTHAIVRMARRRKDTADRKFAKGSLDALLGADDDDDLDFSGLGGPGLGAGEKRRSKRAPHRFNSGMSRNTVN